MNEILNKLDEILELLKKMEPILSSESSEYQVCTCFVDNEGSSYYNEQCPVHGRLSN